MTQNEKDKGTTNKCKGFSCFLFYTCVCVEFLSCLMKMVYLQHLDADYGLYTWPCAPILAQYVSAHRELVQGAEVIEVFEPKTTSWSA